MRLPMTLALLSLTVAPLSAQTFGSTSGWDGVTSAPTLSRDFFAAAVGQSFSTPAYQTVLTSMSFFLGYSPFFPPADQNLQYYAYVVGWDGAVATDLLYRSALQSGSTTFPGLEERTFLPSVALSPNAQYLAFLSTHEADPYDPFDPFAVPAFQNVGLVPGDFYSSGSIVQSQATDFNSLTAGPWVVDPAADLAFQATLERVVVEVPEPSSALLTLTGLLGLAVLRRRRSLPQH